MMRKLRTTGMQIMPGGDLCQVELAGPPYVRHVTMMLHVPEDRAIDVESCLHRNALEISRAAEALPLEIRPSDLAFTVSD